MARPTKLTAGVQQAICEALSAGNTRTAAAASAGISPDSFRRWLASSEEFAEAVAKAEADAEVRHVANITKAASEGTWQASAWWLERKNPEHWRRREHVEVDVVAVPEEERDRRILELVARAEERMAAAEAETVH